MPKINWSLAIYDVIMIDEVSMITHTTREILCKLQHDRVLHDNASISDADLQYIIRK